MACLGFAGNYIASGVLFLVSNSHPYVYMLSMLLLLSLFVCMYIYVRACMYTCIKACMQTVTYCIFRVYLDMNTVLNDPSTHIKPNSLELVRLYLRFYGATVLDTVDPDTSHVVVHSR